jgi:hypothetical protein
MANPQKPSRFRMLIVAFVIAVAVMLAVACSLILRYRQAYRQATEIQLKGLNNLEVARSINIVGAARDTMLPRLIALADDYTTCDFRGLKPHTVLDVFAFGWYDDGWSKGEYFRILMVSSVEVEGTMKVYDVGEMPGYTWNVYGNDSDCMRDAVPVNGGN